MWRAVRGDWSAALALARAPQLRWLAGLGVALGIALMVVAYGVVLLMAAGPGEPVTVPGVGPVTAVGQLVSPASILFMLAMSIFLMVPVASLFSALYLEDAARVVDRLTGAPPPPPAPLLWDRIVANANYFGLLLGLNVLALWSYPVLGWLSPVLFWALNGWLLGREYLQLTLLRRHSTDDMRRIWRTHRLQAWLSGGVMAVALTVPIVNLAAPLLGALAFSHMARRLQA